ncbi:hypothetical protein FKM82_022015 [Ascaphus truei]
MPVVSLVIWTPRYLMYFFCQLNLKFSCKSFSVCLGRLMLRASDLDWFILNPESRENLSNRSNRFGREVRGFVTIKRMSSAYRAAL